MYIKIEKNNSGVHNLREATFFHLETANGNRQTRRKHGHVVTSVVYRKRDAKSPYLLSANSNPRYLELFFQSSPLGV